MKVRLIDICSIAAVTISSLAMFGCASTEHASSNVSVTYTPISSYFKQVRGDSNLKKGYPDFPTYKENLLYRYERQAEEYLVGVKADLDLIEERSDDAYAKIEAVSDAFRFYRGGYFSISPFSYYVRSSHVFDSNLPIYGYEEFNEWPLFLDPPSEPFYGADKFEWDRYREKLLDFAASGDAYIEDGNHYIRNCAKDHELVRQKGLAFLKYLEDLELSGVELDIDLNFF